MKLGDWLPWAAGAGLLWLYYREEPSKTGGEPARAPTPPPTPLQAPGVEPAEFRDFVPPPMPGYSRMRDADVPRSLLPKLRPLLAAPLGTITKLPTEGRDIAAVIEVHFHEPGGPVKPWGKHKGVSLYERKGANA